FIYQLSGRAGLDSNKRTAKNFLCKILYFLQVLPHFHPINTGFLYCAFSAAASMDLGLNHSEAAAILCLYLAIGFLRFMYGTAGKSFLYWNIEFFQYFLGLILVKIH